MPDQPKKLDLKSMDITEEKKQQLKQLFPEVFRENEIDFDHLKRVLSKEWDVDSVGKERFGLQWPGKAACMKIIQQPSVATLKPDREESVNFDETENLFIEGDNLEVLKLLQKSYFGKVKMIYIDPPYNTGNEFVYNDDFKDHLGQYLELTRQKNKEGWISTNKETEGRFHSKWLNMMYPRLFLAKNLLKEEGIVFISIDDNEQDNLKKLCNEIFGEENFVASIIWQKAFSPINLRKTFSPNHDFILCYSKNFEKLQMNGLPRSAEANDRYSNPDDDPRGSWASSDLTVGPVVEEKRYEIKTPSGKKVKPPEGRCWVVTENKFKKLIEENRVWFGKDGDNVPRLKRFLSEVKDDMTPMTVWEYEDVGHNQEATQDLKKLFDGEAVFTNPKPTRLLKRLLQIGTDENDIVLDFFAGSCSTAQAVFELNAEDLSNRKYIMVQLEEPVTDNAEAKKLGYDTITQIGKDRIRKVSEKIKEESINTDEPKEESKNIDLGFKVFKLEPSNFKVWDAPDIDTQADELEEQLDVFADHITPEAEQESILYELILKSGFSLTTPVNKKEIDGKTVYSIQDDALLIYLDEGLTFEMLDQMAEMQPQRIVCLDQSFTGDEADALKTNAVQLFESQDIAFRTV